MRRALQLSVLLVFAAATARADVINTNNPALISAFQAGATVVSFENVTGVTPATITSYTSGNAVPASAFVFNQIPGVQFSVGGAPGTNSPALFSLSGGIAGDATSPSTVLGPVDFDFTTKFNNQALIEIFFPTKVSKVGFFLNPALGNATIIAADTNFAFSKLTETALETGTNVTAGNFVGIQRPTADIGGFKILAVGTTGFTIDNFTFDAGTTTTPPSTVPEPATALLVFAGLGFARLRLRSRKAARP